jgi:hypothetical protein
MAKDSSNKVAPLDRRQDLGEQSWQVGPIASVCTFVVVALWATTSAAVVSSPARNVA